MALVVVVTPILFPTPRKPPAAARDSLGTLRPDSATPATNTPPATQAPAAAPTTAPTQPTTLTLERSAGGPTRTTVGPATAPAVRAETTIVRTARAEYAIASPGGVPVRVTLIDYRSLRGRERQSRAPVNLLEPGDRLLSLRLAGARDTIALDNVAFRADAQRREGNTLVQSLTATAPVPITLTYRFPVDSFVAHVQGTVGAALGQTYQLLATLPTRVRSEEADILDDTRHLAVGYKAGNADPASVAFRQLDSVTRIDSGTIRWVAERNKYFVVAMIPEGTRDAAIRALLLRGGTRTGNDATAAHVTTVLPVDASGFAFKVYAGPQSWDHLRKTAPDLENVNPYGGWLHGVVQPFATIVMRMLLWIHHTLNLGYGWVLVLFGVLVRLILWPLNQNAMRSSMRLQRIQPQLAEIQKKYARDPEKQRDAMLKLYQEHGMSPFTPVLGCLPMLLPMPILFALYFVFQNTIEFRGVSFLWLPDLSLRDPYFITPLFMGVTMFVLSWIGMRGMPPNPQGKMMAYVMPVMFTVLFWNFASGLNLYYAVQNVAALPQQWLLARERTVNPPPGQSKGTSRDRS